MPAPKYAWTEERISEIRRMAREGYSSGATAKAIGVSRGALMGKARRLNIRFDSMRPLALNRREGGYIWAAGHCDEEICRGSSRENVIEEARCILNTELPEGEKPYLRKEVAGMVRVAS